MYNLQKIILLYINEMFKLKINNSKPKNRSRIPLIIHNQMCIHDTRCVTMSTWYQMWGKTYQCQISNAGGMIYRCEIFQVPWLFHDFWWFFKVPWLSMTFPENFIFPGFPGFPDPVGTRKGSQALKAVSGTFVNASSDNTRDDTRFVPSQWETALHCNYISHWLDANLESAL